jgi:hypothetical protein
VERAEAAASLGSLSVFLQRWSLARQSWLGGNAVARANAGWRQFPMIGACVRDWDDGEPEKEC